MTTSYPELLSLMHAAAPGSVFTVMRTALGENLLNCQLWLADYQQLALRSVDDTNDPPVQHMTEGILGRVFTSERPAITISAGATQAYLPVTDHGIRIGVLHLHIAETLSQPAIRELQAAAAALGQHVSTATRFTDHFERARRSRPLTVAAELQWALLPAVAYTEQRFGLAGLLEPAYSVAGDAFDWSVEAERLTVAVCEGAARGVPAALAMTLCVGALRNARRAPLPLAEQAALADQAVYAQYAGAMFVPTVLLEFDLARDSAVLIDAGSPALLRLRNGAITRLESEAQLPLGMFEGTHYRAHAVDVAPGDRLIIVSDGVHGATGATEAFGVTALPRAMTDAASFSPVEATRSLIAELHSHHHEDLDDDAVVVCIDWKPIAGAD
jgi:serine phosphatase RsbU (regulator of sigma subunit)